MNLRPATGDRTQISAGISGINPRPGVAVETLLSPHLAELNFARRRRRPALNPPLPRIITVAAVSGRFAGLYGCSPIIFRPGAEVISVLHEYHAEMGRFPPDSSAIGGHHRVLCQISTYDRLIQRSGASAGPCQAGGAHGARNAGGIHRAFS